MGHDSLEPGGNAGLLAGVDEAKRLPGPKAARADQCHQDKQPWPEVPLHGFRSDAGM